MARATTKVEGLKDLEAALLGLGKSTGKSVLRRVLMAGGKPIQEVAEAKAPVRTDPDSVVTYNGGKVRRAGTAKALVQIGTRLTRSQARLAKKAGKSTVEVHVGTRDPISRLQEHGTEDMPAHPFMRPAWDANKGEALEIIKDRLGDEIERARVRLVKKQARLAAKG
jgi:HK97 gp10 family phage protein